MNPQDSESTSGDPPFALQYGTADRNRPAVFTVIGVIGICMASLGLIVAAFGILTALSGMMLGRAMPSMQWQTPAATTVSICEAVIGAALAATLLTGSIGFIRMRPRSRRILLWWAWMYVLSVLIFLVLQILVVVPSQVNGFSNMMKRMPPTFPTAVTATTAPTTSYTMTYTAGVGGRTVASTQYSSVMGTPASFQMTDMMRLTYTFMAVGKAVICLIFPIVLLVILRLKSVRSTLDG